ncbi:GTP-binding protein Der [Herbaspirillum rubrisubalbicans]|jgi:GTP-binding protein|uniref:GTPase Der n=2 Tax=Herbaspirillum rubrisubalbicans TaxID=80842 RepID=A0AAD0U8C3_9BURK|nr:MULTISPECIES: ribosome biogenesis GTPase Der [Herbaspirillum]ALU90140.1 GTP-binding protein [Herbaspirillum rubrisubalbicans M1]AYR25172.1 ribosome biogenesis GTPase Der [Herbaspirillum rubrisubalbicans]NQE47626.1 GTP-binding protein Der [Herbaspirillum rubrisubalbicans]QJQ01806.1 ribosome biogenesis GTPase Der [Herbaspirillum rubrisubalbicans Os34]RAM64908.1 GTP-binding protein Der [Herbaspirillum rubrisubalbicans]
MKPVIALVGRPNVGKSTLFNRLTRSRDALVADLPGLTRDRHYGEGRVGERPFLVIDTGGFEPVAKDGIMYEMAKQTKQAVVEADIVVFIVDGRQGLTPHDKTITDFLRKCGRSVLLVVNKSEGMKYTSVTADFYELGMGDPYVISAAHGDGVADLVQEALDMVEAERAQEPEPEEPAVRGTKIAIVGRPNVGKSTLVNTLLGEERVIAFDMPGTTRDSIEIPFEREGRHYTLIDTAGIRRRGKVFEAIEKFSVVKTLKSISDANVVLLLLDAQQDISEQDAHIAGFVLESGRALVVGVNKWDGMESDQRNQIKMDLERKLNFLSFAKFHFISALKSTGIGPLMKSIDSAYAAAMAKLSTPRLTRALEEALEHQQPRRKGSIRPKLRYAHQGGQNPPVVVIHGNALEAIDDNYKRYLEKHFRETFSLVGTPLRIEFKSGKNPFIRQEK